MYSRCLRLILLGRSDHSDLRLGLDLLIFVSNNNRTSQALSEDRVLRASQETQHRLIDIGNSMVTMPQTSSTPMDVNPQTAHSSTTGVNGPPESEQYTRSAAGIESTVPSRFTLHLQQLVQLCLPHTSFALSLEHFVRRLQWPSFLYSKLRSKGVSSGFPIIHALYILLSLVVPC